MVTAAVDRQKLVAPRTFEPLGAVQIERYRGTQCVTVSAAVCLDLNNSKRFKSSRGHKFRRTVVCHQVNDLSLVVTLPWVQQAGGLYVAPKVCRMYCKELQGVEGSYAALRPVRHGS